MDPQVDVELDALRGLDSCLLSDALESIGAFGGVGGIAPVWPCGRIIGRAVTVRLRRLQPGVTVVFGHPVENRRFVAVVLHQVPGQAAPLDYDGQIAAARALVTQDPARVAQLVKTWVGDDE